MFIGEYHHTIDDKGRVQVPSKWRSKLAEGAVVTKGFDGSLTVFPLGVWQQTAERLAALPQSQPQARAFVRQTLAGAVDLELDKLGRVLLPAYLREYAGMGKQLVLAGLHDHVEIWEESRWNDYINGIDQESSDYTQTLKELGI